MYGLAVEKDPPKTVFGRNIRKGVEEASPYRAENGTALSGNAFSGSGGKKRGSCVYFFLRVFNRYLNNKHKEKEEGIFLPLFLYM